MRWNRRLAGRAVRPMRSPMHDARTLAPVSLAVGSAKPAEDHPILLVDRADIPGGGELLLMQCGDDFSIQFGEDELMGTRSFRSEQALAVMTRDRMKHADGTILIGGLGMGFTLDAALDAWEPPAQIVVAELVPKVLEWARGPLSHLSGVHLDDPRVTVRLADVHDLIETANGEYDAILLDVDNGPDGFITAANERLYCNWGLRAAYAALRPQGILAIWSAYSDDHFVTRLEGVGFRVEEVRIPAFAGSTNDWHSIWFAAKG